MLQNIVTRVVGGVALLTVGTVVTDLIEKNTTEPKDDYGKVITRIGKVLLVAVIVASVASAIESDVNELFSKK